LRHLGDPAEGSAGVIAAAIEGKERLVVTIEQEEITLRPRIGSANRAPLPPSFRHEVYHQLLVERNAGRIRVRLDGLVVLEGDFAPGPAQAGIYSEMPAAFDGITLTEHFFDDFRGGEARGWWSARHSHWDVRDGALVQPEANPGRQEIAKGEALWAWELEVDLQLRSKSGAGGVAVHFVNDGRVVEAALTGTAPVSMPDGPAASPPSATGTWLCRLGDEYRAVPPGFDPTAEHHLRLERNWENRLSLWLDGKQVAALPAPADISRFSLFTEDAAAAFRDVSFTGLGG